jgi:MFS family permease
VLVRLVLTITSLAIELSAPLAGIVADRAGRKPVLVGRLALYAVAGVAGYFVDSLAVLLVTRTVLGIAVGGVMTAVSATITDWFDGPKRASFLGLQQAFASIGGVVFLPLAGLLATSDAARRTPVPSRTRRRSRATPEPGGRARTLCQQH